MSPLQSALARRLEGRRHKEVRPRRGKCGEADFSLPTERGVPGCLNLVTVGSLATGLSPGNLVGVPSWVGVVSSSNPRLPVRTSRHQETSCAWSSALHTHWLLTHYFMLSHRRTPTPVALVPGGWSRALWWSDLLGLLRPSLCVCRRYSENTTSNITSCLRTSLWRRWFSKVSCLPRVAGQAPAVPKAQVLSPRASRHRSDRGTGCPLNVPFFSSKVWEDWADLRYEVEFTKIFLRKCRGFHILFLFCSYQ